jgi:hypothetical protein
LQDPRKNRVNSLICNKNKSFLHCKKDRDFFHPSQGVTLKNSPWPGIIKLFPPREILVSDIPTGDGKIASFFTVYCKRFKFFCLLTSTLSQLYKKAFIVSGAAAVGEMGAASQNPFSSNQGL